MDSLAAIRSELTLEVLLDRALREANAREFRDTAFVPALERVLRIPDDLAFTVPGLQIFHANLLRFLVNRLRHEADVQRHPEILDEPVDDPIVIVGLPRSGTTKLQRLLSANPAVQATHTWRMFNPAPFPGETRGDPSPRIEWTKQMIGVVSATNARYNRIHEFDALQGEETSFVPLANFDYVMQYIPTPSRAYLDWVRTEPRTSPLLYMKRMLQYMQWFDGGKQDRPWVIKNPGHLGEIAELHELFPRATFVVLQRDIATNVGSIMQMMWEIYESSFPERDRYLHGRESVEYWSYEMRRYWEQRRTLGSGIRVVEVPYRRLLTDAMGIAREVHATHGLPLTPAGEADLRAWEVGNPVHKHGKFHYDLADFRWEAADVERAFGEVAEQWRGF
jgi:hypothetical protein